MPVSISVVEIGARQTRQKYCWLLAFAQFALLAMAGVVAGIQRIEENFRSSDHASTLSHQLLARTAASLAPPAELSMEPMPRDAAEALDGPSVLKLVRWGRAWGKVGSP